LRDYFTINRDGTLKDARISESSGNTSYDNSALRAVLSSNPVTKLPVIILADTLWRTGFQSAVDSMRISSCSPRFTKTLEVRVHSKLRSISSILILAILIGSPKPAAGQDWFRTAIGMDANKPRLAIADFAARSDSASPRFLFTQVVRDDLQFSGILELASPSFYPPQAPSVPAELKYSVWTDPPTSANFVGFGNLSESTAEVAIEAWLYDVRNLSSQAVVGKVYRGPDRCASAEIRSSIRRRNHQQAIRRPPGVASTQIAFVSSRTGTKEIWVMDYDGSNQRPLTSLKSISLTPRWSPDASRIAFHLLRSQPRPHQCADLYVLHGHRQARLFSTLPRYKYHAHMVA